VLTRLIREALFHLDSERHLSRARPAGDADPLPQQRHHRLRMLPFVDDKSDDVGTFTSQGVGHQSYSPTSDHGLRNALGKTWSPGGGRRCTRRGCPARRGSSRSRRPGMRQLLGGGWSRGRPQLLEHCPECESCAIWISLRVVN
jgi:hypothetical protein